MRIFYWDKNRILCEFILRYENIILNKKEFMIYDESIYVNVLNGWLMLSSMIIILMVLCVNLKWLNWMEIIFKMNLMKLRIKLEIYIIIDRVVIS